MHGNASVGSQEAYHYNGYLISAESIILPRPNMLLTLTDRRSLSRLLPFVVCGAIMGCEKEPGAIPTKPQPAAAKEVAAANARLEPWPETIRVQGSLLAYEEATVGSKLAGRVDTVEVDIGTVVKAGDPLVTLVRNELELRVQLADAQLRQATAAVGLTPAGDESNYNTQLAPGVMMEQALVSEAESNLERARSLVTTRAITQGEYDTLIAALKAAKARYDTAVNSVGEQVSMIAVRRKELALAQQMLADSRIVAPFAGVVGDRRVSPGEYVQAGQAVVTLVRADKLRFTAGVPESRAASVRVGQRVEIHVDGSSTNPLVASISRISPTVLQSNRSVLIQADVANPELKLQAGLFGEAELFVDHDARAIVVPLSAVSRFAGVEKVWVVSGGVAAQQTVRTGRQDRSRIEIVDGIAVGDVLVRNATEGHDGPVLVSDAETSRPLQAHIPAPGSEKRAPSGGAN
jgi:RND family efflux transporter MFP subunit